MGTFLIQEQLFVWEYQWDLSVWDFMLSYSYIKKSPQSYHVTMLCLISPAPHILEQIFSYKYIFLYIKQILFNLCTYTVFFLYIRITPIRISVWDFMLLSLKTNVFVASLRIYIRFHACTPRYCVTSLETIQIFNLFKIELT